MVAQNRPRVSLGMPVYNGAEYLRETLTAVLNQTFTDFVLVVCDNASTDETAAIVKEFMAKDGRIHYFRNEINIGAAGNYNRVFHLCPEADYFKWVAHDDSLAPDFLEKCIAVLDAEPEVVLCYPASMLINRKGEVFGEYADGLHLRDPRPYRRLRQFFARPGMCHAVFGLIRMDALRQTSLIGNFPRSDRNLLGELTLYGQFYELEEKLFLRRIHPKTSTRVHVTEYELATWFDPHRRGRLVFPRWRRFWEYVKAIWRAPLSGWERVRCYLVLLQFTLMVEKWRGVLEDVWVAVRLLPSRLLKQA
ncbi:MAG: glycosyltransferase family 2 protein [Chloroflexi bacterium]|nr:MAG: glycosyltransferase family 2 protein [Chloroflexota bacterium]